MSNDSVKLTHPERLRCLIDISGLTPDQLGKLVGYADGKTVEHLIAGRRGSLPRDRALAIARALRADPAAIFVTR